MNLAMRKGLKHLSLKVFKIFLIKKGIINKQQKIINIFKLVARVALHYLTCHFNST